MTFERELRAGSLNKAESPLRMPLPATEGFQLPEIKSERGAAEVENLNLEAESSAGLAEKLQDAVFKGARSIPKVIESAAFLVLGNLSYYLPGGEENFQRYFSGSQKVFKGLFGDSVFKTETLASLSDEELSRLLNPLHHLSEVVAPILSPLHEGAELGTNYLLFLGYNVYRENFANSRSVDFAEFLQLKAKEENWELRLGENTLYALEALGIAFLMAQSGGLGGTRTLLEMRKILQMPMVMSSLSVVGKYLESKADSERPLQFEPEELAALLPQIVKGTFDSTLFMGSLAAVSRPLIFLGARGFVLKAEWDIGKQLSAGGTGSLPQSVLRLPQRVESLSRLANVATEGIDFTEGAEQAYEESLNFLHRVGDLVSDPLSKRKQLATLGSFAATSSAIIDLVDMRASGETQRNERFARQQTNVVDRKVGAKALRTSSAYLEFERDERSIAEKLNSAGLETLLKSLGGAVLLSSNRVLYLEDESAVQALFNERNRQAAEDRNLNAPWSEKIKNFFEAVGLNKRNAATRSVSAFYDRTSGAIILPRPRSGEGREQAINHLAIECHEATHARIHELGLEEYLKTEPSLGRRLKAELDLDITKLSEPLKRLQLEEIICWLSYADFREACGLSALPDVVSATNSGSVLNQIRSFVEESYSERKLSEAEQKGLLRAAGRPTRVSQAFQDLTERFKAICPDENLSEEVERISQELWRKSCLGDFVGFCEGLRKGLNDVPWLYSDPELQALLSISNALNVVQHVSPLIKEKLKEKLLAAVRDSSADDFFKLLSLLASAKFKDEQVVTEIINRLRTQSGIPGQEGDLARFLGELDITDEGLDKRLKESAEEFILNNNKAEQAVLNIVRSFAARGLSRDAQQLIHSITKGQRVRFSNNPVSLNNFATSCYALSGNPVELLGFQPREEQLEEPGSTARKQSKFEGEVDSALEKLFSPEDVRCSPEFRWGPFKDDFRLSFLKQGLFPAGTELIIECDGPDHFINADPVCGTIARNRLKNAAAKNQNILVLRIDYRSWEADSSPPETRLSKLLSRARPMPESEVSERVSLTDSPAVKEAEASPPPANARVEPATTELSETPASPNPVKSPAADKKVSHHRIIREAGKVREVCFFNVSGEELAKLQLEERWVGAFPCIWFNLTGEEVTEKVLAQVMPPIVEQLSESYGPSLSEFTFISDLSESAPLNTTHAYALHILAKQFSEALNFKENKLVFISSPTRLLTQPRRKFVRADLNIGRTSPTSASQYFAFRFIPKSSEQSASGVGFWDEVYLPDPDSRTEGLKLATETEEIQELGDKLAHSFNLVNNSVGEDLEAVATQLRTEIEQISLAAWKRGYLLLSTDLQLALESGLKSDGAKLTSSLAQQLFGALPWHKYLLAMERRELAGVQSDWQARQSFKQILEQGRALRPAGFDELELCLDLGVLNSPEVSQAWEDLKNTAAKSSDMLVAVVQDLLGSIAEGMFVGKALRRNLLTASGMHIYLLPLFGPKATAVSLNVLGHCLDALLLGTALRGGIDAYRQADSQVDLIPSQANNLRQIFYHAIHMSLGQSIPAAQFDADPTLIMLSQSLTLGHFVRKGDFDRAIRFLNGNEFGDSNWNSVLLAFLTAITGELILGNPLEASRLWTVCEDWQTRYERLDRNEKLD